MAYGVQQVITHVFQDVRGEILQEETVDESQTWLITNSEVKVHPIYVEDDVRQEIQFTHTVVIPPGT